MKIVSKKQIKIGRGGVGVSGYSYGNSLVISPPRFVKSACGAVVVGAGCSLGQGTGVSVHGQPGLWTRDAASNRSRSFRTFAAISSAVSGV